MASPLSPPLVPGAWILVTGGAGFIGSHVVDALLERGYRVGVVDDLSTGSLDVLPAGIPFHQVSILDSGLHGAFHVHPFSAVVHCAAQVKVTRSMEDPALDLRVNVAGTCQLLQLSVACGLRRFVFLSTGGAMYGDLEEAATEGHFPRPASYYALHKLMAEQWLALSGFPSAVLRFGNVYGPRQRADLEGGVVATFQERLRGGRPVEVFGSGEQARDFLYVRDAVRAVVAALESSRSGLWNIGVGYPTSVNELLQTMSEIIAPPVEIHHLPTRPGEIHRAWLDSAKAERELDWRPLYGLEAGLRETVTWAGR